MSKCKSCGLSFKDEIIGKDTKIKKLIKENKRLKRKIKAMDSLWESWSKGIEDMIESD